MADEEVKEKNEKEEQKQEKQEKQEPGPVPYDRFKEVNDRAAQLQKDYEKLQAKFKADEEAKLKEQGKWQELAEANEKKAQQIALDNVRLRIGVKKGLPENLVDRLRGETEEEMEADADSLLELVTEKKKSTTTFEKHDKDSNPTRIENTPKAIREHTAEILESMKKRSQN